MCLWAVFAGIVARAAPESWFWPERMAARTLRLDQWTASRRLAATSQTETWNAIVAGVNIVKDNQKAIDMCMKVAAKADDSVRCAINIYSEVKNLGKTCGAL